VANGADPELRERRGQLGPTVQWIDPPADTPRWIRALGLIGAHNVTNALIAQACMVALGVPGADDERRLAAAAAGFVGLPARLRTVGTVDGVTFIDDGLSTNVLPTLAALQALSDQRVALIVGGFDRGIDYQPLAAALTARTLPTIVLHVPEVGARIAEAIARARPPAHIEMVGCAEEGEAALRGWEWARPGGVVLLSPAAPSYGRYHDYTERSAVFAHAMERCLSAP